MEQSMLVMSVKEYTEAMVTFISALVPIGFMYCVVFGLSIGAGRQMVTVLSDWVKHRMVSKRLQHVPADKEYNNTDS